MNKITVDIEPRIMLPKDSSGDTYIGVYIDDKEVSRILVDKDNVSAITNNEGSINQIVQSNDGKTTIDLDSGKITLNSSKITLKGKSIFHNE